jgi:hypothetical protein
MFEAHLWSLVKVFKHPLSNVMWRTVQSVYMGCLPVGLKDFLVRDGKKCSLLKVPTGKYLVV